MSVASTDTDFEQAYEVWGKHYNGDEVTKEEQQLLDKVVTKIANEGSEEFTVILSALYMSKYIT